MIDFEKALQALREGGVEFVVIGGLSAKLHGSAYITEDLDICYDRSRTNLQKLVAALNPFHPRPRGFPDGLPFVWDEACLNNMSVLTLITDIGEVDLLSEVAGVGTYADVKAGSKLAKAYGQPVATLRLRKLIASKRASGRTKDLLLIPELEALLEATEEEEE